MERAIQELKIIIREMLLELGQLKERVAYLENNNAKQIEPVNPDISFSHVIEAESYDNLGRVYNDGFHVCPVAFGQIRDGECLFCIAFMEKE